jgi:hypothetical protein
VTRRPWIFLAALALVAGAACSSPFGRAAASHPVLTAALKLKYTPGETITYGVTAATKLLVSVPGAGEQPVNSNFTATETMKVISVDPDGTASIDATLTDMTGTANGNPIPAGTKIPTTHLKIAPDGRIVSAGSAAPGSVGSVPGGDQITPLLPSNKVKPGDRWTRDYSRPNPFGSGTIDVHTTNQFVRYETIGGTKYAVIATSAQVPLNLTVDLSQLASVLGIAGGQAPTGNATYTGRVDPTLTSWINPADGELNEVKNSSAIDITMTVPGSVAQSIHLTGTVSLNLIRK